MDSTTRFRWCAALATLAVLGGLIALCVRAASLGPITSALRQMAADPWGLATLADLAVGLAGVVVWMGLVEGRRWRLLLWIPALMVLGNIATCAFLLARLPRARNLREWLTQRL